jgi:hypothetical protein
VAIKFEISSAPVTTRTTKPRIALHLASTASDRGGAGLPCPSCNKSTGPEDAPDVSRLGFVPAAGELVGGIAPDNEAERHLRCPKCGQVYDARDPDAVLAHDGPLPHRIEIQ